MSGWIGKNILVLHQFGHSIDFLSLKLKSKVISIIGAKFHDPTR
jgi:hypothetical protein